MKKDLIERERQEIMENLNKVYNHRFKCLQIKSGNLGNSRLNQPMLQNIGKQIIGNNIGMNEMRERIA